ncbi:P27 family phage terminase small subunit [Streptomyces sp. NPDC005708]|uniref:phage terminase small subunit n=1 Tax=Streptomyces sp. NPDC005708 TaxID=3154564 RepID=UPI0033CA52DE
MAGRGPARKDPERRQRRNAARDLEVVADPLAAPPEVHVPSPPAGLLKRTRERWAAYWASPVARLADPVSDLPALERLFALYDDLERSNATVKRRGHMVTGSQGQAVLNPLLRHIQVTQGEVRQLEDRFGLSPRARLSLNVTLGEAAKSLADLNSEFTAGGEDDDDPRFDVVDGEVLDDSETA